MCSNPARGPIHFHTPARMFYRTVRGMIPHKTPRGANALKNLTVFEGIPPQYERVKRMVVPNALRVIRVNPLRKTAALGDLARLFGWTHHGLIHVYFN